MTYIREVIIVEYVVMWIVPKYRMSFEQLLLLEALVPGLAVHSIS